MVLQLLLLLFLERFFLIFFCLELELVVSFFILSYRGKLSSGKVTKLWLGAKNFARRNFYSTKIFTRWIFLSDKCYQIIEISARKWHNFLIFFQMNTLLNALILRWALIWENIKKCLAVNSFLWFKGGLSFKKWRYIEHLQHYIVVVARLNFFRENWRNFS